VKPPTVRREALDAAGPARGYGGVNGGIVGHPMRIANRVAGLSRR
jgi:hypothetical protein